MTALFTWLFRNSRPCSMGSLRDRGGVAWCRLRACGLDEFPERFLQVAKCGNRVRIHPKGAGAHRAIVKVRHPCNDDAETMIWAQPGYSKPVLPRPVHHDARPVNVGEKPAGDVCDATAMSGFIPEERSAVRVLVGFE